MMKSSSGGRRFTQNIKLLNVMKCSTPVRTHLPFFVVSDAWNFLCYIQKVVCDFTPLSFCIVFFLMSLSVHFVNLFSFTIIVPYSLIGQSLVSALMWFIPLKELLNICTALWVRGTENLGIITYLAIGAVAMNSFYPLPGFVRGCFGWCEEILSWCHCPWYMCAPSLMAVIFF